MAYPRPLEYPGRRSDKQCPNSCPNRYRLEDSHQFDVRWLEWQDSGTDGQGLVLYQGSSFIAGTFLFPLCRRNAKCPYAKLLCLEVIYSSMQGSPDGHMGNPDMTSDSSHTDTGVVPY
ncbi:hypothetical protein TNCV_2101211 [Trichonephila clavipes]|nr:hypothetical protein TNCV_2101211 [Trichonephila clavipes]